VKSQNLKLKTNLKSINTKSLPVLKKAAANEPQELIQLTLPFKTMLQKAIQEQKRQIKMR
jgi:hypothetical protein